MGTPDPDAIVAIYRRALPQVFGYLLPRCGSVVLAEDLTAETFMAAVAATQHGAAPDVTIGWLVGIARHKLVDHWRRLGREERSLASTAQHLVDVEDPWEAEIDAAAVHAALALVNPQQRAALTLRYLDGLPVPEVAEHLERSLHATETLLARARAALRRVYQQQERHGD